MDIYHSKNFSLTQLSISENIVIFEQNSINDLFKHIKNEPKHGQRVVVFDLDHTFMCTTMDIETLELIKTLQINRCLVVGITKNNSPDKIIKTLLEFGVNLNQGFFKDIKKSYKSHTANYLLHHGLMFVNHGAPESKKQALNALIEDFHLDPDDVYFVNHSILLTLNQTVQPIAFLYEHTGHRKDDSQKTTTQSIESKQKNIPRS